MLGFLEDFFFQLCNFFLKKKFCRYEKKIYSKKASKKKLRVNIVLNNKGIRS